MNLLDLLGVSILVGTTAGLVSASFVLSLLEDRERNRERKAKQQIDRLFEAAMKRIAG